MISLLCLSGVLWLHFGIEVPSISLLQIPAAAGAIPTTASLVRWRFAAEHGIGYDRRDQDSDVVLKARRKDMRARDAEKEEEYLRLSDYSWVACNSGICESWVHFADCDCCYCPACRCRWSDSALRLAQECGGRTQDKRSSAAEVQSLRAVVHCLQDTFPKSHRDFCGERG